MIDHILTQGHLAVQPTVRMLKHWWKRLNHEVFHDMLLPCSFTIGPSEYECYGLCYPLDGGRARIHIDSRVDTRVAMLATLAHEMVHQLQHQLNEPMTHGNLFQGYAEVIRDRTTLTI